MPPGYPQQDALPDAKVAYLKKLVSLTNPIAHVLSRQAARNALYASGRMNISWSSSKREWREIPLEEGERFISMNHIRPILRARTQRLLSAPVDFTLIPDSNALEERDKAQMGANFLQSRYRLQNMQQVEDTAFEYAYYGGCAFLKSFWNPSIGPLVAATLDVPEIETGPDGLPLMDELGQPITTTVNRPVKVESGTGAIQVAGEDEEPARYRQGDTDTTIRTVFQVRANPEATGFRAADGLRYILDLDEVPLSEAKRRYPDLADKIKAGDSNATGAAERSANTALIRNPVSDPVAALGYANSPTLSSQAEEKCLIVEYWELESPYFPRGRLVQLVGDAVAYDGDFPDGIFPYDALFDEPAAGWAYGRPCVNDMIDPSDVINRQWTAIDQEMWDQGIGQYVSWDIPGVPNQLGRTPRQVIKIPRRADIRGDSINNVFKRMEHGSVPPDRWRMIESAERTLFDVGAYHEITRGQTPPGVTAGVAIEQLREQENGQLQKAVTARKETLISWGRKQLQLARRYYKGVERWIPVHRPDLGFQPEGVTGLDLPDPETAIIELENFKPRSEQAFKADINELLKNQIIGPQEGLRLMDLGRGVEGLYASQTRQYAKARQENLWMERGEADLREIGQQPVMAKVTDPVTGAVTEQNTGVMEPVMRVVHLLDTQEDADGADLETGGQVEPLILPTEDDHEEHIRIHQEIVLDMTNPLALRQLALAHITEHREQMAQAAVAAPPSQG